MSAEAVHFNMHEAKTNLSRIIERVERGEEIIMDRAGHAGGEGCALGSSGKPNRDRLARRESSISAATGIHLQTNAEIAADFGIGG